MIRVLAWAIVGLVLGALLSAMWNDGPICNESGRLAACGGKR